MLQEVHSNIIDDFIEKCKESEKLIVWFDLDLALYSFFRDFSQTDNEIKKMYERRKKSVNEDTNANNW